MLGIAAVPANSGVILKEIIITQLAPTRYNKAGAKFEDVSQKPGFNQGLQGASSNVASHVRAQSRVHVRDLCG